MALVDEQETEDSHNRTMKCINNNLVRTGRAFDSPRPSAMPERQGTENKECGERVHLVNGPLRSSAVRRTRVGDKVVRKRVSFENPQSVDVFQVYAQTLETTTTTVGRTLPVSTSSPLTTISSLAIHPGAREAMSFGDVELREIWFDPKTTAHHGEKNNFVDLINMEHVQASVHYEEGKVKVKFMLGATPHVVHLPPSPVSDTQVTPRDSEVTMARNGYTTQMSTESGWENPFRPGGELSREADEVIEALREGRTLASPTPEPGHDQHDAVNGLKSPVQTNAASPKVTKSPTNSQTPQSPKTVGLNGSGKGNGVAEPPTARAGPVEIQRSAPQEPQQPEHVVLKKKKKCCVIQ